MELNRVLDALYARYQEKLPERMHEVFPPPAAPQDIAAAEAALGMPLPEELRALYARHASMTDAWDDVCIDPVQSIAKLRQSLEDVASDMAADAAQDDEPDPGPLLTASGPVAPVIYAPSRIPFGSKRGDLLIDLVPPAGGTPGQIVHLDIEWGTIAVVADSLTEFFAQGLETFSNMDPGASGEPGRLASWLLRLAGLPIMLVMTLVGILVVAFVLAWNILSMAAESIAGLFHRKQE